ncbi:hypothetical protein OH77DRAFT_832385 [Trametes cingulata]|nr:hypothetical protein OH77DRAFT_832385 [Trametes cingulata]
MRGWLLSPALSSPSADSHACAEAALSALLCVPPRPLRPALPIVLASPCHAQPLSRSNMHAPASPCPAFPLLSLPPPFRSSALATYTTLLPLSLHDARPAYHPPLATAQLTSPSR